MLRRKHVTAVRTSTVTHLTTQLTIAPRSRDSLSTLRLQIATHKDDSSDIDCLHRPTLDVFISTGEPDNYDRRLRTGGVKDFRSPSEAFRERYNTTGIGSVVRTYNRKVFSEATPGPPDLFYWSRLYSRYILENLCDVKWHSMISCYQIFRRKNEYRCLRLGDECTRLNRLRNVTFQRNIRSIQLLDYGVFVDGVSDAQAYGIRPIGRLEKRALLFGM
ncbi:hypothetical protein CLF_103663 [Clonorchis sinensis]|uniref:Uncharacterized protein n=1 Tax=Clonorchis sinensis TaxID=79923 RepID=G7YA52_CLOSI|nr:hypothetical protein CLF_103663 [Clonorchis sinensis]